MPAIKKFFDRMMVNVLSRRGETMPDLTGANPRYVAQLQKDGYIDADGQMTPAAFMLYFARFERIGCPPQVQQWVEDLRIGEVHWRRAGGVIRARLEQNRGSAYPALRTVFIGDESDHGTWYHELGHVLYNLKVAAADKVAIATEARKNFPVLRNDAIKDAADPATLKPFPLPDGIYMLINKRYCGLDHSGTDEDAQNDEIWANVFAQYCENRDALPESVFLLVDEILDRIRGGPDPG